MTSENRLYFSGDPCHIVLELGLGLPAEGRI